MAQITLRVLDGADRGRCFEGVDTPITVGREEGNTIQLNDERISRFHIKIQEDNSKVVLTDLESTNGTKVNGEDIQLRILRFGDMIMLGRSVLLFGTRDQIALRLAKLRNDDLNEKTLEPSEAEQVREAGALDFELNWRDDEDLHSTLHALEPPEIPGNLSPGQAAQLAELLEYFQIRLRHLLSAAGSAQDVDQESGAMRIEAPQWQNLLDMQSRLAEYIRTIGEPD